jgi:hypothetical protein
VNGYLCCGLPARCCQPAVAGGVIYADLRGELNTHLALQALFTQSSPVHEPLLQVFPFPSTLGEVTLHLLSQACMFIYSSHGKWSSPLSCGVFLPPLLSQAFLLLVAGRVPPLLPSPAGLFIYSYIRDFPSPPLGWSGHPGLFATCLFCCYYSVSLFFPGWGSVCPGGYADLAQDCLWEYHVPLSSPYGPSLSKLGAGIWWQRGSPPGFSV